MKKLLVFTDLDGTLLHHSHYRWDEAAPALIRLQQAGFPLLLNSSKTAAELMHLNRQLDNCHPFISENGGAISLPGGYYSEQGTDCDRYDAVVFARPYAEIIQLLQQWREKMGFQFKGFHDLDDRQVAELTGLNTEQSQRARLRETSEPLIWQDSDSALDEFKNLLSQHGLDTVQGGRFLHIKSPVNKGDAVRWLVAYYQQHEAATEWITVALGDSFNDIEMLNSVQWPILVPNPAISQPDLPHLSHLYIPELPGPAGWNLAIHHVMDKLI